MLNNNSDDVLYAGFFVRLSAYAIDWTVLALPLLAVKIPTFFSKIFNPDAILLNPVLFNFNTIDIILYLLSVTYFTLMTYYTGATLGKKLLKIKVCKDKGEKLSFIDVLYRESIGRYLSALIIWVGYILILVDPKNKGLHDILCDTVVVYDIKSSKKEEEHNPKIVDNVSNIKQEDLGKNVPIAIKNTNEEGVNEEKVNKEDFDKEDTTKENN